MAGFGGQKKKIAQSRAKDGRNLLEKAVKLHQEGKIVEAKILYLKLIDLGFCHEIVFSNLGVIYKSMNSIEEAKDTYERAILFNPRFANAHANLGNLFKEQGELDKALASTLKSLELKPDNPDAHMNMGGIYKDLGQLDKALVSTLKSLELKPDNPTAHMNLGGIYKELGQLDQAFASTIRSLELKADNPDAHINLGGIYKELGQLDFALTSTLKSLELKPDHPTAYMNLGGIYKELGQLDQALEFTLKSLELKPDHPTAHMNLGGIYKDLGQLDLALASTLRSLELKPDNPDAHMNLGAIYFDRNEYKNAEKEVTVAIDLHASKLDLCFRIKAACLFFNKDYNGAVDILEKLQLNAEFVGESLWETNIALSATSYAREHEAMKLKLSRSNLAVEGDKKDSSLVVMRNRPVEEDLLRELRTVEFVKLSETAAIDAREGEGLCTNFKLFDSKLPSIERLSRDLRAIAAEALSKDICSLRYDSFFNIFKSGSGTRPHKHLVRRDNFFGLWRHKYSLVYYLEPGDQDCKNPGILKMYDPDVQICPERGMIVIIPATRAHSSYYDGSKNRLMVGINFYAFEKKYAQ